MSQKFILHAGDPERMRILANIAEFVRKLTPAKSWIVEVRQYARERTDDQNRALWGVAYPALQNATGQSVEDWHTYMLGEWFGWVEYELFGKKKLRPARTTTTDFDGRHSKLTTAEFAEYYSFIQLRAAQNGVHVPDPDPLWRRAEAA